MISLPVSTLTHLLLTEHLTDAQAALRLNVSRSTIARRRKNLNLSQKPKRSCGYYDLSPDQDEKLSELYAAGRNDYEVAAEMHLGRNRLRLWRQEHGIPSHSNKKGLTVKDCPQIIERIKNKESLTDVGEAYNVKRTSIAHLLDKYGYDYEVRSRPHPRWASDYKLTPLQVSVLIGDMFGDGGIVPAGPETAYYQCAHCPEQRPFIEWKYKIFSPLSCRMGDGKTIDKRTGVKSDFVCMGTWSNKELRVWRDKFYPSGEGDKVLTVDLAQYLDWLGLAVWFMGDGTRHRNRVHFSVGLGIDLPPIAEYLNKKFGSIFEPRKYKREWHLNITNPKLFFDNISPYMLPCFEYKKPFDKLDIK